VTELLHVAVGVITNRQGQILIAKRHQHAHQGGLWEFPGGKVEAAETLQQALKRELYEELGINVLQAEPLIQIPFQYPDKTVLLDVCSVVSFSNEAKGCEGQEIRWVMPEELTEYRFPAANKAIMTAVLLPEYYAILEAADEAQALENLEKILAKNIRLIQIRLKNMAEPVSERLLQDIVDRTQHKNPRLSINSVHKINHKQFNAGIHLSSRDLMQAASRPECGGWLSASCHNQQELEKAQALGVDFVVLAPVQTTASHPEVTPLGWDKFQQLCRLSGLPVYALGGVQMTDVDRIRRAGGQGVAGISTFL